MNLESRVLAAIERQHGFTLHPPQLAGGRALIAGKIAEMATGEGKTAAALLPLVHHAIEGRTVFVATANDYLARRDAGFASPVLRDFGFSVGFVQGTMPADERRGAYRAGITYGTMKEFVFDFLRDRSAKGAGMRQGTRCRGRSTAHRTVAPGQPEPDVIIVDEADSILLDEAATPCVLSSPAERLPPGYEECLKWTARIAPELTEGTDYVHLPDGGVALTPKGRIMVSAQPMPESIAALTINDVFHCLELSLRAADRFHQNVHYVVDRGEVLIVDEFTGRISEGRKWRGGVHQAVEAKERVPLTIPTEPSAAMTIQDYVRRFAHVSGMTGTAVEAAREFKAVYALPVLAIPRHRPLRRRELPDMLCRNRDEKWDRIVEETQSLQSQRAAVLIGTRTIHASQELSQRLGDAAIEHVVLNARNPEAESEIVAQAGQPGRVTVATNMAGRGTDIRLHETVRETGGLHVIGTELHASARIDRQLAGRCARQGDPGVFRQYLSLDDDLLEAAYGVERAEQVRKRAVRRLDAGGSRGRPAVIRTFRTAQQHLERTAARQRRQLCRTSIERNRMLRSLGLDPILTPLPDDDE
jgi:preprotein translocase subunit SecA